jgi:hypothetical protein
MAGNTRMTALGAVATLVVAGALAGVYASNTSSAQEDTYRRTALAAPIVVPGGAKALVKTDRNRRHTILLQLEYTRDPVHSNKEFKGVKALGWHGVPWPGDPTKVTSGNVEMIRRTLADVPMQLYKSERIVAHEGDVVKTTIDTGQELSVACNIKQDGRRVVRDEVANPNPNPRKVAGVVSCIWVVQPVG